MHYCYRCKMPRWRALFRGFHVLEIFTLENDSDAINVR